MFLSQLTFQPQQTGQGTQFRAVIMDLRMMNHWHNKSDNAHLVDLIIHATSHVGTNTLVHLDI
jgi:hypothetical protein